MNSSNTAEKAGTEVRWVFWVDWTHAAASCVVENLDCEFRSTAKQYIFKREFLLIATVFVTHNNFVNFYQCKWFSQHLLINTTNASNAGNILVPTCFQINFCPPWDVSLSFFPYHKASEDG